MPPLTLLQVQFRENISFETQKTLSTFEIFSTDIVKFIRSLDPNRAHVMTEHQFLCKNCVLLQYLNHCKFFTKTFSVMYDFLKHGRMLTSFVFLEKVISSWKKTIDLSRYCLFRGKLKKNNIFNSLFEHLHDNNLLNNTQMRIPFWRFLCTPAVSNNKQYL